MYLVREHNSIQLSSSFDDKGFEYYLNDVWQSRNRFYDINDKLEDNSKEQAFFTFQRNNELKAGQYVGFIQYKELSLSVYPKLFHNIDKENDIQFYRHLVYWLSYCRRINFPFNDVIADLDKVDDFPEALIYFFAKRTLPLLQSYPYHQFEVIEETMMDVKGRLLISRYFNESLATGNFHKLICEHEPLQFDNRLNRIIKSVARKLLQRCRFKETWYLLEQILFLLEDASDTPITALDCDKVKLNPIFSDYKECLDMCRFFLNNEQLQDLSGINDQFCFLLPMNYVFEDYICGFIEDKFKSQFKSLYQHGTWLTDQKVFRIQNDLVLKDHNDDLILIIDTKYKLRQRAQDAKKGISQGDLYQMLAYAIRHSCRKVLLIYPKMHNSDSKIVIDKFTISSELIQKNISIFASDVLITSDDIGKLDNSLYVQLSHIINKVLNTDVNESTDK